MRGISGCGGYLPYRRLDCREIAGVAGGGGRQGRRAVASFDEDATTMAVEAARLAIGSAGAGPIDSLWYTTVEPPYLDRTNANAVHAALHLDRQAPAYDVIGSMRSGFGALRAALGTDGTALVVAADVRAGLAGGPDEAYFGDGAAALIVNDGTEIPVLAEILAWSSVTDEFVDRWRTPGDVRSKVWEERFGEVLYTDAGVAAIEGALKEAGIDAGRVDRLLVTGTHARAVKTVGTRSHMNVDPLAEALANQVGVTGAAHPFLLLAAALETAQPDQVIGLVGLADGAEVLLLRTTPAVAQVQPVRPVAGQVAGGAPVSYGRYLSWRGVLPVEPPRRPEPARVSASAAARSAEWKFGLVGSRSPDGVISAPPAIGDVEPQPMAGELGTVRTFTIDRLSYTPSPPMVFAVVDFDGGGRIPVEVTDVDAADVHVGDRVELVFRRLSTADGIHNYFWKARPLLGRSG